MFGTQRDYVIRYIDGDQEAINVSDDEDLLTAYEVAQKELRGSLKFIVDFKKAPARMSLNQESPVPPKAVASEESKVDLRKAVKEAKKLAKA